MNINKVFVAGRLTDHVNLRITGSGTPVASFSLATNFKFKGKDGQVQETTEYHNIVVWGHAAENCNSYLQKGSEALVEGRLQTRSWQDKEGGTRKTTEIIADSVQFGPRPGNAPAGERPAVKPLGSGYMKPKETPAPSNAAENSGGSAPEPEEDPF